MEWFDGIFNLTLNLTTSIRSRFHPDFTSIWPKYEHLTTAGSKLDQRKMRNPGPGSTAFKKFGLTRTRINKTRTRMIWYDTWQYYLYFWTWGILIWKIIGTIKSICRIMTPPIFDFPTSEELNWNKMVIMENNFECQIQIIQVKKCSIVIHKFYNKVFIMSWN